MKQFVLLISMVLFISTSNAQWLDTLQFGSRIEKEIFKKKFNVEPIDPVALLILPGREVVDPVWARERIGDLVSEYRKDLKTTLPKTNTVKSIARTLKSKYLINYKIDAKFKELFLHQFYNNLSAAALYAVALDELKIRYVLVYENDLFSVEVDCDGDKKVVLTETDPSIRNIQYSYSYQKFYVDYLVRQRLVLQSRVDSTSVSDVFEQYYLNRKPITLENLAGLQYFFQGTIWDVRYSEYDYSCLYKASLLYPDMKVKFLFNEAMIRRINQEIATNSFDPVLIANYALSNPLDIKVLEGVQKVLLNYATFQLIENPDIYKYEAFYKRFFEVLNDENFKNMFYPDYLLNRTTYLINHHQEKKALEDLEVLNYYLPHNPNIERNVLIAMANSYFLLGSNWVNLDTIKVCLFRFPFLKQQKEFVNYFTGCYVHQISEAFRQRNVTRGQELLGEYYTFLTDTDHYAVDAELAASVLSPPVRFYTPKNMKKEAEYWPKKFLTVFPGNELICEIANIPSSYEPPIRYKQKQMAFYTDLNSSVQGAWEVEKLFVDDNPEPLLSKCPASRIVFNSNNKCVIEYNGKIHFCSYTFNHTHKCIYILDQKISLILSIYDVNESQMKILVMDRDITKGPRFLIYYRKTKGE